MGRFKEMDIERIEQEAKEITAIEAMRSVADQLDVLCAKLAEIKMVFNPQHLPVQEAVEHISACLKRDAQYLDRLADICENPGDLAIASGE